MKNKKVILIILVFVMFFTSVNFTNFSKVEATTNGYTPDTAIEYVKSLVGKQISVDALYPGECVDLIMEYERELSGVFYSGDGKDYAYNDLPDGWIRKQKTERNTTKRRYISIYWRI